MERILPETDLRQWVLTFPFRVAQAAGLRRRAAEHAQPPVRGYRSQLLRQARGCCRRRVSVCSQERRGHSRTAHIIGLAAQPALARGVPGRRLLRARTTARVASARTSSDTRSRPSARARGASHRQAPTTPRPARRARPKRRVGRPRRPTRGLRCLGTSPARRTAVAPRPYAAVRGSARLRQAIHRRIPPRRTPRRWPECTATARVGKAAVQAPPAPVHGRRK